MNRPLPLIAGLLGVLFLAIAATYWLVPVGRRARRAPLSQPEREAERGH